MYEQLLHVLPGPSQMTRVELYQIAEADQQPYLELRQTTDCGALGWRVEKRIALAPGTIPMLREAINLMDLDARQPARAGVLAPHLRLISSSEYNEAM